ncbi:MAG: ribosomal L7Ae/L30e/S12e/Gadd45 family protein [Clostridia bacterium]|nr:ribosomal L7Ae/L30e/S12e/Gadd45 family protein [Clostridia bacterium]
MNKFLLMLGLCRRAGALVIGTPMVTEALPKGKISVVYYASDASANTEKKITDKCKFYGVQCIKLPISSDEISHAIGKSGAVCALGIADESFSRKLTSLINEEKR